MTPNANSDFMDKPESPTGKSRWAWAVNKRMRGGTQPQKNNAKECPGKNYPSPRGQHKEGSRDEGPREQLIGSSRRSSLQQDDEEGSAEMIRSLNPALLAGPSRSPGSDTSSSTKSRFAGLLPKPLSMPSQRRSSDIRNAEVQNPHPNTPRASLGAYPLTSATHLAAKFDNSSQRSNSNKPSKTWSSRRSSLPDEGRVIHRKSDELRVDISAASAPQLLIPPSPTSSFPPRRSSSPLPSAHPQQRDRRRPGAVNSEGREKQWWEIMFWDILGSILETPCCPNAEGGSPTKASLDDKQLPNDFASGLPLFASHQQQNPMANQVEHEQRGLGFQVTTSGTLTFRRIVKPPLI